MGNITSTQQTTTNTTLNQKTENIKVESENQQNILIEQVIDVAIELLKKYNQEFLREDFCYDVAFVMEQQLNGMSVKVLRDIEQKMNNEGKQLTPELKMILQYMPKEEEKFFIEGFEKQLNDLFWNHNLVYDPEILKKEGIESEEGMDLSTMDFFKDKNKFRYIDLSKVNELLRDRQLNKKRHNNAMEVENMENNGTSENELVEENVEVKEEVSQTNMQGGANVNVNKFKQELKKELSAKNNKKGQNNSKSREAERVEITNNAFSNNNLAKLQKSFKNTLQNPSLTAKNKASAIQEIVVENLNKRIGIKQKQLNNAEVIRAKQQNQGNKSSKKVRNLVEMVRENVNSQMNRRVQEERTTTPNVTREELKREVNNLIQKEMSKMSENVQQNQTKKQNKQPNQPTNKQQNKTPNKQENKQPNQQPNKQPNKKKNEQKPENIKNENGLVRFSTPKDYQKPTEFCLSGVEKCSLTKKNLCKVITENIIVRCNIIAAILSVLPSKKSKTGEYYGGYLYSKFLNLGRCQVCVPKNYMDLKKLSPLQLVKHVSQYSDFMDFKTCKDNGGYFLKLSKEQIKSLYDNVPKNAEIELGDKTNFNAFYIDCAENLKTCYFDNLKVLLDILMELKNNPFINNDVLNQIGLKTKQIIDTMYHLSQYYYIFGIVSLLNANINKVDEQELVLQQSFSKMLKKKTKTTASM